MKLSVNLFIQIFGVLLQGLTFASGIVPAGKWQAICASVIGVIQAVSGLLAHFSNPDGTSATVPYVKPLPTTNPTG